MIQISQLVQHLADLNPAKTPGRLTLYNFLKNEMDFTDTLNEKLLNRFFACALDFPHWQQNRLSLAKEIKLVLSQFHASKKQSLDEEQILFPDQMQVIEIENFADLMKATAIYLRQNLQEDDKFSLISDQGRRLVALILKADKTFLVSTFDRKFTLRGGRLEPLRDFFSVAYNENLELQYNFLHRIEVAPYIYSQFKLSDDGCHGNVVRGYVFQKHLEIRRGTLNDFPRVYHPLKRLEQFFIEKSTDPFYRETTALLEKTAELIQKGDMQGLRWAKSTLHRGEAALEHIYIGDKNLTSLIKILRSLIQSPGMMSHLERAEECQNLKPIDESGSIN